MISEVDKDGSGEIDFDEFLELMVNKMMAGNCEDELVEAFKIFDKKGTDAITAYDIQNGMAYLGEHITMDEIQEMISEADTNGDGKISYREFVMAVLSK